MMKLQTLNSLFVNIEIQLEYIITTVIILIHVICTKTVYGYCLDLTMDTAEIIAKTWNRLCFTSVWKSGRIIIYNITEIQKLA